MWDHWIASKIKFHIVLGGLAIVWVICMGGITHLTSDAHFVFGNQALTSSKPSILGVTGTLFKGDVVRTYRGPRLFSNYQDVHEGSANKRQQGGLMHPRWAVCTTIHAPTQAILDFVKSQEWAIIIIGDQGMAPFHVDGPFTVFLNSSSQEQLRRDFKELYELLPWRHFGRKNLGYLFAIMHGAELIWDFDDDNYLKDERFPEIPQNDKGVYTVEIDFVSAHTNCSSFNPLPLMGGPAHPVPMWPRGYPLNHIKAPCNYTLTRGGDLSKVAIFQSLADHEPDVDGIFRLSRPVPMYFYADNNSKATLIMSPGFYSPYNAQATLITRPAFWSLLLPISVHGRVSDIWRSYIAQRLLSDVGRTVAFTAPMVKQLRNVHNPLADMKAEDDLYFKSLPLLHLLMEWKSTAVSLPGRYEELILELYAREYLGEEDVRVSQEWLRALVKVGYRFPALLGGQMKDYPTGNSLSLERLPADAAATSPAESKRLTLWTSDLHDGTRCDIASMFSSFSHNIILAGSKGTATPYPEVFARPLVHFPNRTLSEEIRDNHLTHSSPWTEDEARALFTYYKDDQQFQTVDAFVCMFPSSYCEAWMPFNKSIIMWAAHRYALGRCTRGEWERLNDHIQAMAAAKDRGHVLAGITLYDVEYMNYFTGLRPRLVPSTSLWYAVATEGTAYQGHESKRSEILVGPLQRREFQHMASLQNAGGQKWSFDFAKSIYGKYEFKDLLNHRAMVLFPYATTSYGFIEVYALAIPIFVPDPSFLYELGTMVDRRLRDPWYCGDHVDIPPRHPDSIHMYSPEDNDRASFLYWIEFSDFYQWPFITKFSSWDDLISKLDTADFDAIHRNMTTENEERKKRLRREWSDILAKIPTSTEVPESFDDGIGTLWNVSTLMVS